MAVSVADQARALLGAIGLGTAAGLLYDLFRVLRVRIPLRWLGPVLDLLFWLCCTITFFLWSVDSAGGLVRIYTAIAALMAMVNEFYSNGLSRGDFEALLLMLSPFAPHMVEELWEQKGFAAKYEGKMAMQCAWPEYDESKTVASSVEMAVQVSGKFKGTIIVPVDSDQDTVVEAAKASEKVAKAIAGMQIVNVIHVKNKLVNLIVKPC